MTRRLRPKLRQERTPGSVVLTVDAVTFHAALALQAQRLAGLLSTGTNPMAAAELKAIADELHRQHALPSLPELEDNAVVEEETVGSGARLFAGQSPALWDGLRTLLWRAAHIDIVVAYATASGVNLVAPFLMDVAGRGGTVRLLVGSYLFGTRPDALEKLLNLAQHGIAVRFLADPEVHFHPKVYHLVDAGGHGHVFVGSANLSRSALMSTGATAPATEWTMAVDATVSAAIVQEAAARVDALWRSTGVPLTREVIRAYELIAKPTHQLLVEPDTPAWRPVLNAAQAAAFDSLRSARAEGVSRGLVVLATGVGKTVLSALDSVTCAPTGRVLFVAHRQEILRQAANTFARVRPGESCGLVTGEEKGWGARHVFASVFSLSGDVVEEHVQGQFEYVVIDEAHHAAAGSYTAVLERCGAAFVLGLTATPDRMDGEDIYSLFDNQVLHSTDVVDAIQGKMLVPFHYFGLADTVDYRTLAWTRRGYDPAQLEAAVLERQRMERVLAALKDVRHRGERSLVFCVSIAHANAVAAMLNDDGIKSVAVHSAPGACPREQAIQALRAGTVNALCTVDLFNEGVDIPEVDRVVFLRPTDSATVFLQQLGRGLRLSTGKAAVTVVDFVGNHRRSELKPELLGVSTKEVLDGQPNQPFLKTFADGRQVYFAPEAVDAMRAAGARRLGLKQRLLGALHDLHDAHPDDARPTYQQLLARTGVSPGTIRALWGCWWKMLEAADLLGADDKTALTDPTSRKLLQTMEDTEMSGPHKPLLLLAMLSQGSFRMGLDALVTAFRNEVQGAHPGAQVHFFSGRAADWAKDGNVRTVLRSSPIKYLVEGDPALFTFEGSTFQVQATYSAQLAHLLDEVCRGRLFHFLRRRPGTNEAVASILPQGTKGLTLMVQANRDHLPPSGTWVALHAESGVWHGKLMAQAINVIRRSPDDGENEATAFLQQLVDASSREQALGRRVRLVRRDEANSFTLEVD